MTMTRGLRTTGRALRAAAGALTATLVLAGCFQHTTYFNRDQPAEPLPRYVDWNHHIFWGFIDVSGPIDADAVCPEGVATVKNQFGPVNAVLAVLTGGIYAPTETLVTCVQSDGR